MSIKFAPLPFAASPPPQLRLMRLMFASLLVSLSSASPILLIDCLKLGAVVLIVAIHVAEV